MKTCMDPTHLLFVTQSVLAGCCTVSTVYSDAIKHMYHRACGGIKYMDGTIRQTRRLKQLFSQNKANGRMEPCSAKRQQTVNKKTDAKQAGKEEVESNCMRYLSDEGKCRPSCWDQQLYSSPP